MCMCVCVFLCRWCFFYVDAVWLGVGPVNRPHCRDDRDLHLLSTGVRLCGRSCACVDAG